MSDKPVKILLIEDNPRDTQTLREMLAKATNAPLDLECADRLSTGLKRLAQGGIDLVLLDLFLPESRGLKTLRRVHARAPLLPVVAITRLADEEIGLEAVREGAQDYLVKGQIDSARLVSTIRHAIARQRTEEALRQSEDRYRKLAEKLQWANAELETFVYSVSHDLRAPLRAIRGFAEILAHRQRANLNEQGQHYLDNIVQASAQMGLLIDDLLAYSRIGRQAVSRQPVPLCDLLARVTDSLATRIDETGAHIDIPDDLPVLQSERTLLIQILSNLIANALTFHRPSVPPRVAVSCQAEPDHFIIRVADNGIGIPSEHYNRIFNVFQRLHDQDEYPGTGIGLAIVKKSVELLGGKVGVESVVGEGSTFWVKLPRETKG